MDFVITHPRAYFQESYPTDIPAVLLWACEGLDDSDLELPDDADDAEVARRMARIEAVESAHQDMYWKYGCEVSVATWFC